jgi:hypothetical protein
MANWPIISGQHLPGWNRRILNIRYVGSTTSSVGPAAAAQAATTIGSTATITNCQACYNAIYADALGLGFSDAQAAAIAAAATLAYAAVINNGGSVTQAQQAATAAAVALALADGWSDSSTDPLNMFGGGVASSLILAAAFSAFTSQIPTSNQATAASWFVAFLASLGLSL